MNSMSCLRLCIWMGLSITWVTATIFWFFFFFWYMWSESTTAGARSLLCTLKVPQQNGLKCSFQTFSLERLVASSAVFCHCCHFLVKGGGEAEEISPWTQPSLDCQLTELCGSLVHPSGSAQGQTCAPEAFQVSTTCPSGWTCSNGQLDHVLKSLIQTGQCWLCPHFVVRLAE